MDICKMTAKGAGQHNLPTLAALHRTGIPLRGCNPTALHPSIGVERELGPYPTRGANHCLHLLRIRLKPHPLKQPNEDIQHALKEFRIPRCKVRIVDIEDGKEG
jgi:hypothetical protein